MNFNIRLQNWNKPTEIKDESAYKKLMWLFGVIICMHGCVVFMLRYYGVSYIWSLKVEYVCVNFCSVRHSILL